MNRVNCYPQDGKRKSYDICAAFARGCGGRVVSSNTWAPGDAMFYGVSDANEGVWKQAQAVREQHAFFYADNAFFDECRQRFFRVGINRLQHPGTGTSDGSRFRRLGLPIRDWRTRGEHILVTPQSDHFMNMVVQYPGNWLADTLAAIKRHTDRPIQVRLWNRDKAKLAQELPQQLENCWALVTHSSASAITALMRGIPVVATAQCIITPMSGRIEEVDNLPLPAGREQWAHVVADQQWTLDEFRSGECWADLHR